jgi:hypothetical protein
MEKSFYSNVVSILEQYILDVGGPISYRELETCAGKEMNFGKGFLAVYLPHARNIINAGNNKYTHVKNLNIYENDLSDLINSALGFISQTGCVSVHKIFGKNRRICKFMNITHPEMLYSVLQRYGGNKIHLPGYPHIYSVQYRIPGPRDTEIGCVVAGYIAQKKRPCSFDELESDLIMGMGFPANAVYGVVNHEDIVRYGNETLIHVNTIKWTMEKQQTIEALAMDLLRKARKRGCHYASIGKLSTHCHLPLLCDRLAWTPALTADLLSRSVRFRILGSARNAFVNVPKGCIISFEDLICEILKNYNGRTKLKLFERVLRDAGIIRKRIVPEMLGKKNKVYICGPEIMLATK